jgi:hypothetical protein
LFTSTARQAVLQKALFAIIAAAVGQLAHGQTTVGIQPLGSYTSGFDQVSLSDLGVHIDIPLFSQKGRGQEGGLVVHLLYDTSYTDNDGTVAYPYVNTGWRLVAGNTTGGVVQVHQTTTVCNTQINGLYYYRYSFSFVDSTGYYHIFPGVSIVSYCNGASEVTTNLQEFASDGTGYYLSTNAGLGTVTSPSGIQYSATPFITYSPVDTNGNQFPGQSGVTPDFVSTVVDSCSGLQT